MVSGLEQMKLFLITNNCIIRACNSMNAHVLTPEGSGVAAAFGSAVSESAGAASTDFMIEATCHMQGKNC